MSEIPALFERYRCGENPVKCHVEPVNPCLDPNAFTPDTALGMDDDDAPVACLRSSLVSFTGLVAPVDDRKAACKAHTVG